MTFRLALLAAAGTAALGAANAQEAGDSYGALGAGIAIGSDNNRIRSDDADPTAFIAELETDDNVAIYGALGRYFGGGLRGEVELATRTQNIESSPGDGLGFGGLPNNDVDLGDISATTLMVNVLKDFNVDAAGRLTPYVGLGVGVARIRPEFQNIGVTRPVEIGDDTRDGFRAVVQDKAYTLAGQAMAGLSFDFTDNMMIDVRYKYLRADDYEAGGFFNDDFADVDGSYVLHEVTGGLRWNFGGSAPAPVATVPTPPPPVEFKTCFDGSRVPVTQACPIEDEPVLDIPEQIDLTVYFDYDSAALTDASRAIIAARADEAREFDVGSITVQGNTDTSGSAAYNQRLSQRRANVVRDALISNGIDASVITIEALGESNPAKPTADGIREPLNRRTEVEFDIDGALGM